MLESKVSRSSLLSFLNYSITCRGCPCLVTFSSMFCTIGKCELSNLQYCLTVELSRPISFSWSSESLKNSINEPSSGLKTLSSTTEPVSFESWIAFFMMPILRFLKVTFLSRTSVSILFSSFLRPISTRVFSLQIFKKMFFIINRKNLLVTI